MLIVRSLVAAFVLFPGAGAAAELPRLASQPSTAEESIRRALDGPVAESVSPMRLADFIEYLRAAYDIEVQLDGKVVSEGTVRPTQTVAMPAEGVRLRTALELALRPLELTWTIYDDALLITTPDEADQLLVVRVYDVADLIQRGDDGLLIDLITTSIVPTNWDEVGGPGAIQSFASAGRPALAISQSPRVHEEIAGLLTALRQVGRRSPRWSSPPNSLRPHSLGASDDGREPSPARRRRSRVYQAADWMTPQLHP